MTSFEHAMLGVSGVMAAGLPRRYGWQIAAVAGAAAVCPDWDGLTILCGTSLFAAAHRLWGHNVLACVLVGFVVGAFDYRFDLVTRCGRWADVLFRRSAPGPIRAIRADFHFQGAAIWILVAVAAALSHLPADLVFSGHATLPDWPLQPLWPFSDRSIVFPMVPWGDPGVSILMAIGMLAMWRWRGRLQIVSIVTLCSVTAYIVVRGVLVR